MIIRRSGAVAYGECVALRWIRIRESSGRRRVIAEGCENLVKGSGGRVLALGSVRLQKKVIEASVMGGEGVDCGSRDVAMLMYLGCLVQ